jgi:hypothetical protein
VAESAATTASATTSTASTASTPTVATVATVATAAITRAIAKANDDGLYVPSGTPLPGSKYIPVAAAFSAFSGDPGEDHVCIPKAHRSIVVCDRKRKQTPGIMLGVGRRGAAKRIETRGNGHDPTKYRKTFPQRNGLQNGRATQHQTGNVFHISHCG